MSKIFRPRGIESDGLKYYRERSSGDYVAVNPETAEYYTSIGQPGLFEGRATAISKESSSVCTTSISGKWLRDRCRRVRKADIPKEWLDWIDMGQVAFEAAEELGVSMPIETRDEIAR